VEAPKRGQAGVVPTDWREKGGKEEGGTGKGLVGADRKDLGKRGQQRRRPKGTKSGGGQDSERLWEKKKKGEVKTEGVSSRKKTSMHNQGPK